MKSPLMAKPHATSTPNKGKQFEDVQKSKKNRSTIRKVSPTPIVGNTSIYNAFQSFDRRKKQKLSTSNEKIFLSDTTNECPVTAESQKSNLSDTAMSEVSTMGSLSKDTEFEFENSLVTELSLQQKSKAWNEKTSLSKTNQMQNKTCYSLLQCLSRSEASYIFPSITNYKNTTEVEHNIYIMCDGPPSRNVK